MRGNIKQMYCRSEDTILLLPNCCFISVKFAFI